MIKEILPEAEALEAIRTHPELARAIESIGKKTGIPENVLRKHLGEAILETLDKIGEKYVAQLGEAIRHTEVLRNHIHDFYERVLDGLDRNPDPGRLSAMFGELHELAMEISDPQLWAKKRLDEPGGAVEFEPEPTSSEPAGKVADPAAGIPGQRMGPAAERRLWALPEAQRNAVLAARRAHPDLAARALAGDAAAASSLIEALRGSGVDQATLDQVAAGISAVREPGFEFALGGSTGVTDPALRGAAAKRFEKLPKAQRDAVAKAAKADPDFVRKAVTSRSGFGDPHAAPLDAIRPKEMDAFCQRNGISPTERAQLETALRDLNKAFREAEASWTDPESLDYGPLTESAAQRRDILDRGADALGLPRGSRIAAEMARAMATLRQYASMSHEQFLDFAYEWLRYAENKKGKAQTLRSYIQARMRTHVRGMVGEFSAAFQLGPDFWVLKGPDFDVTVPGTDYVVVSKANGEIWFCDNKTLSENSLGRVTSLVENIPQNMAEDVAEFGAMNSDGPFAMPDNVVSALANAQSASRAISDLVKPMSEEQIKSQEVQDQITAICDQAKVRRVVSNAGGQLGQLSSALSGLGIDFANLDGALQVVEHPTTDPAAGEQ